MRYKQDLGGIVSSGSMVEELDANGNSYERIYRKNAILILVSDPISITPPAVVERNLGKYPKVCSREARLLIELVGLVRKR
ncbi:MAG: hypothetical protein R3B55_02000 [Candidatus Paceibacterota bacterium]